MEQTFEAEVSEADDLDELWGDVEAFAGTLLAKFEGDLRITFTVEPIIDPDDEQE